MRKVDTWMRLMTSFVHHVALHLIKSEAHSVKSSDKSRGAQPNYSVSSVRVWLMQSRSAENKKTISVRIDIPIVLFETREHEFYQRPLGQLLCSRPNTPCAMFCVSDVDMPFYENPMLKARHSKSANTPPRIGPCIIMPASDCPYDGTLWNMCGSTAAHVVVAHRLSTVITTTPSECSRCQKKRSSDVAREV